jgi:hypothetical protein
VSDSRVSNSSSEKAASDELSKSSPLLAVNVSSGAAEGEKFSIETSGVLAL